VNEFSGFPGETEFTGKWMEKQTTLVLANDHAILREGIVALCGTRPDLKILGQCDGNEAVEVILRLQPDFTVLELNLPGVSGLDVIRRVRLEKSETRLIVLSTSREKSVIRELFRSGADGYLLKEGPAGHLFEAIHYIQRGGQYLTSLIGRESIDNKRKINNALTLLSRRENEVFSFLVRGMRPKDIAKSLGISPKTVDAYRAGIMRKLEVDGIASLVRFAIHGNIQMASTSC
jgi:DNA-binding NarL/FixJ family response regulator